MAWWIFNVIEKNDESVRRKDAHRFIDKAGT
jgi:hypothetical protein